MFKKATIAVLGFTASGLATAGSMGPVCTPGNVTVPCEAKLWDLGAQALYFRSVFGSSKAYDLGTLPLYKEVKNDWNWGYRIEGSYHFNTGNDVTVNWLHFSSSADPSDLIGTLVLPPLINTVAPFDLESRDRIDQVNVVMGQHTDLGMRDKLRFYGGMQYANIQATDTNYYATPLFTEFTDLSFSLFDNTSYQGFGPVVGIDYSYDLTSSLSVTANGAGSILYGTSRYHAGFVISPYGAIPAQVSNRHKGIVPGLEAKLGLNYAHPIGQGVANIQLGYQVLNYFKALQEQPTKNLIGEIHPVDYGLFGPYFGLKYVGNA